MLGLNGKESERDNRFSHSLPLNVEKADIEATTGPVQREKSFVTRFLERYRKLPLLSRIISILASVWIIFASMRFVHHGFSGRGRHGSKKHGWVAAPYEEVCSFRAMVMINELMPFLPAHPHRHLVQSHSPNRNRTARQQDIFALVSSALPGS